MLSEIEYAAQMMRLGGYTLVVCAGGGVFVSEESGIRPLLSLVGDPQWRGASSAVRSAGRAEAMLFAVLGVSGVRADVLSEGGRAVLDAAGIAWQCGSSVKAIHTPVERAVAGLSDPSDAPEAIRRCLAPDAAEDGCP